MIGCVAIQAPFSEDDSQVLPVATGGLQNRIVIAEDHDEFRYLLREAFEDAGYRVTECIDGNDLYGELTRGDTSDLAAVVSDHRMPGMLGLDVLARLGRKRPRAPFILITAFGDHSVHWRARHLAADLVVNKPLEEDELVRAVEMLRGVQ